LEILRDRSLFGFWRRFGSVTGLPVEPAPSPKPCQKPKILAAQGYIFSFNALIKKEKGKIKKKNQKAVALLFS